MEHCSFESGGLEGRLENGGLYLVEVLGRLGGGADDIVTHDIVARPTS